MTRPSLLRADQTHDTHSKARCARHVEPATDLHLHCRSEDERDLSLDRAERLILVDDLVGGDVFDVVLVFVVTWPFGCRNCMNVSKVSSIVPLVLAIPPARLRPICTRFLLVTNGMKPWNSTPCR
jgi:hypothetical protein